jgi:predicted HTH transcriptional regulator
MEEVEFSDLVHSLRSLPAENGFCEFKENWDHPEDIGKLVSALSNGACLEAERCGYIVWGIRDSDHEIVGTAFQPQKRTNNQELEFRRQGAPHAGT